jgi:hypothetical protein
VAYDKIYAVIHPDCMPRIGFTAVDEACKTVILTLIYLSTAIGFPPGGSTHLHTNSTQNITINNKTTRITNKTTQITNFEECWPCPVLKGLVNSDFVLTVPRFDKTGNVSITLLCVTVLAGQSQ